MESEGDSTRRPSGVHEEYRSEAQEMSTRLRDRADATVRAILTDHAQAAARRRDDDHVGTEHVVLGIYLHSSNDAAEVLSDAGISQDVFEAVLDDEPGPSPDGFIPYTVRATMIGGLAVAAADRRGDEAVAPLHLLLGAAAESARWDRQHAWGPHHLRTAAAKAGTSLMELEHRAAALLDQACT